MESFPQRTTTSELQRLQSQQSLPGQSLVALHEADESYRGDSSATVRRRLVHDVRRRAMISREETGAGSSGTTRRRPATAAGSSSLLRSSANSIVPSEPSELDLALELLERARRRGELLDRMLSLTSTAEHMDEIATAFEIPHEPRARPLDDKGTRALRAACEARLSHSLEDVCSICLSERRKGQRVLRLPGCGHVFHSCCVRTWLARSGCCPSCRREITPPSGAALVHGGFRSSHALAALALPQGQGDAAPRSAARTLPRQTAAGGG